MSPRSAAPSFSGSCCWWSTGYLFAAGKRHAAWFILATVLGGAALNSLLKLGFARPRPDIVTPLTKVLTLSFPSGHAALSAVCYLTLGVLLAQTQASCTLRIYFIATAMLLTLLVGSAASISASTIRPTCWRAGASALPGR